MIEDDEVLHERSYDGGSQMDSGTYNTQQKGRSIDVDSVVVVVIVMMTGLDLTN